MFFFITSQNVCLKNVEGSDSFENDKSRENKRALISKIYVNKIYFQTKTNMILSDFVVLSFKLLITYKSDGHMVARVGDKIRYSAFRTEQINLLC